MKKRIKLGFALLTFLLLTTGVMSYLELARLNNYTQQVVDLGAESITLSSDVMDAVISIDNLIDQKINSTDSLLLIPIEQQQQLRDAVSKVKTKSLRKYSTVIDELERASNQYLYILGQSDTTSHLQNWYFASYKGYYKEVESIVKKYINVTQEIVVSEISKLKNNAYRSIMYGIVATATAIVVILFFYFLINVYYISPIVALSKALKNYLNLRIPFDFDFSAKDEVFMLKEYIDQLIVRLKAKKE